MRSSESGLKIAGSFQRSLDGNHRCRIAGAHALERLCPQGHLYIRRRLQICASAFCTGVAHVSAVPAEPKSRKEHHVFPAMLDPANSVPWGETVTTRVTYRTVVFRRPFLLDEADGEQPPGAYTIETEEELLESVSFPVYRRISVMMHCHAPGGITRFVTVDAAVLDAALAQDGRGSD